MLGFFAAGSIVYVHCPLTNDVIVFHRELYDRAMAKGASVDKLYAPGRWVPHCTIAQACQTNLMKGIRFRPIVARARSMIHVMYPPTTLLAEKSCHVKQAAGPDACSTGEL